MSKARPLRRIGCVTILLLSCVLMPLAYRSFVERRAIERLSSTRNVTVIRESIVPRRLWSLGLRLPWSSRVTGVVIADSRFEVGDIALLEDFRHLKSVTISSDSLSDSDVCALSKLPLRRINILAKKLTDRSAKHLASMSELENINIESDNLTDESLRALSSLPRLRDIRMQLTGVTDAGLMSLSHHPTLRIVDVKFTMVTPEGVESFRRENPGIDIEHGW